MNISIFGYKLSLEILILIGIIYLIMVGHTFCGCCNYTNLMEGFTNNSVAHKSNGELQNDISNNNLGSNLNDNKVLLTQAGSGNIQPGGNIINKKAKETNIKNKEGFVGANTNFGDSSPYDINSTSSINTASWSKPNMTVTPGQPLSSGVKQFLNREPQPVPLPDDEMLMFANTPFKPECCPNTYSNGSGCACMTGDQYNYLMLRGSNNVPYSQY